MFNKEEIGMLNFINVENSREGIRKLLEIIEMYRNAEIEFEPSREMRYYHVSPDDRFLGSLVEALASQLKTYTHFLDVEYKDEYLYWMMEEGRLGYERAMLEIHKMKPLEANV